MSRIGKQLRSAAESPVRLRVGAPVGLKGDAVDAEGGMFKAGLIRDYSVITRGEALGHSLWIDKAFLDEVVAAGNAKANGLKSRFTHPGLSGDGLGTTIGRTLNFRKRYGQVVADLHLLESSHDTPDGDLGGYVLQLAQEAPDLFGASIVFNLDEGAMKAFESGNRDDKGGFKSPDPLNKKNLAHARLATLAASDIVDEPAANEGGMFSAVAGSELATAADAFLAYALGLSDEKPAALGGFDADRARTFVSGFMQRRNLSLSAITNDPDPEPEPEPTEPFFEQQLDIRQQQISMIGGLTQ